MPEHSSRNFSFCFSRIMQARMAFQHLYFSIFYHWLFLKAASLLPIPQQRQMPASYRFCLEVGFKTLSEYLLTSLPRSVHQRPSPPNNCAGASGEIPAASSRIITLHSQTQMGSIVTTTFAPKRLRYLLRQRPLSVYLSIPQAWHKAGVQLKFSKWVNERMREIFDRKGSANVAYLQWRVYLIQPTCPYHEWQQQAPDFRE